MMRSCSCEADKGEDLDQVNTWGLRSTQIPRVERYVDCPERVSKDIVPNKRRSNMPRDQLVIQIAELPLRAKKLHPNELRDVFGGCGGSGQFCDRDKDCCSQKCGIPTKEIEGGVLSGFCM